ncbi:glycosyltransferase family 4 protein [Cyclobacterium sp.]|uniref:glycosyltransferase family 4 protein n=1 Tax=Cyclobacterium sp. TaxID=1966343 RepID=UPI0019B3CDCA|nr:glycosyltransferase family 4 protein [Cyclobacterium sp.]MBD3630364.1 glycosyltransferase family 4 protein [Cyclobacterium sp.]
MKRILYLSFYFKPDLCAGSFRNTPLLECLARTNPDVRIDVMTTLPNRYGSFSQEAPENEILNNVHIHRIAIPKHKSGIKDQILSFKTFYEQVRKEVKGKKYDLVFASSSRLFTAYLGYRIASSLKVPLYLDIRDIFVDTMAEVLHNPLVKKATLPVLKVLEKQTFAYASHINLISPGFAPYFASYTQATISYYTNGIDPEFVRIYEQTASSSDPGSAKKTILYAGNMGQGQGLEKIVPQAATSLGNEFHFKLIGDGGTRPLLEQKVRELKLTNVTLHPPVSRIELLAAYQEADYLLMHLNDYNAFKKVLPSKVFELAMFKKPVLAGVGGYSRKFLQENLPDTLLFDPGDHKGLVKQLQEHDLETFVPADRTTFIDTYLREKVNQRMADSILSYLLSS